MSQILSITHLSACFCKSTNIPCLGKVFDTLYFDKLFLSRFSLSERVNKISVIDVIKSNRKKKKYF